MSYRRKGPLREFTDDHVRANLQTMSSEAAWKAMERSPAGHFLGELDANIDIAGTDRPAR